MLAKSTPENTSEADVAESNARRKNWMESASETFHKEYEQAGCSGRCRCSRTEPGQDAGPAPEGFNGDDVVDGDYKEV